MTGITADLDRLPGVAQRVADTAARLAAGADPGPASTGGPPVFTLPQAAQFVSALAIAHDRQAAAAAALARFYADAGTSLSSLGSALAHAESTATRRLTDLTGDVPGALS